MNTRVQRRATHLDQPIIQQAIKGTLGEISALKPHIPGKVRLILDKAQAVLAQAVFLAKLVLIILVRTTPVKVDKRLVIPVDPDLDPVRQALAPARPVLDTVMILVPMMEETTQPFLENQIEIILSCQQFRKHRLDATLNNTLVTMPTLKLDAKCSTFAQTI